MSKTTLLQQTFIDYKNIVKQIQMLGNETEGQECAEMMITELKNGEIATFTTSQYCVKGVVEELISGSWQQIELNRFFSRFLPTYSNMKLMSNMDEVNNLLFNEFPCGNRQERQQAEPTPLFIDSLLPVSADIDEENVYKKNNSRKIVFNEDEILAKSKAKERTQSEERTTKYTKLEISEISEEDGFTKQLRKINEQKNKKMENEKAAFEKKQQLRLEQIKNKEKKKGQRQDKFCYDYNGDVFQVRMESKANLVSKVINGSTNTNPKVVKQVIHDPNPIEVEPTNGKSKKLAMLMYSKRKDQVQFSQMKSLADNIQTRVGVKYTYEGKTYQEKTKPIPAAELRKTLSQRKISKEDYKRVRDLNGNKKDYEENMKNAKVKEEGGKHQRTYSQAKYSDSRLTNRKPEKIHVSSNELKGKLLEKIPQITYEQLPSESREETPPNRLGHIDSFNLEYLRSGGSLHANTSKQFYSQRSSNQLPKITHTTIYTKMLPKGRERIKDANEIIRDLRKKFEEKLRV